MMRLLVGACSSYPSAGIVTNEQVVARFFLFVVDLSLLTFINMPDNCVAHFPSLEETQIPPGIVTYLLSVILLSLVRLYLRYLTAFDSPPKNKLPTQPSHGVPVKGILILMTGIGLALNAPQLILWFIFHNSPGSNAEEFACLFQNSSTGGISGLIIAAMAVLIMATNRRRQNNSVVFARSVISFIKEHVSESPRIATFPCFRGMWVASLVREVQANIKSDNVQYFVADLYQSKFNPETDVWMKLNMRIGNLDKNMYLFEKLEYSNLPFQDSSLDVVVMPLGNLNLFFTSIEDESERNAAFALLFAEVRRVLRPNGLFIATVTKFLFSHGWFNERLTAGFELVPGPTTWIFNTFIPSVIVILRKCADDDGAGAGAGEGTNVLGPAASGDDVEATQGRGQALPFKPDVSFTKMDELHLPEEAAAANAGDREGAGKQWILIYALTGAMVAAWVVAVVLTWAYFEQLSVPTFLPYGSMVSAVLVSNWQTLPIVMYFLVFKMVAATEEPLAPAADPVDHNGDAHPSQGATEAGGGYSITPASRPSVIGRQSTKMLIEDPARRRAYEDELAARRVLRAFRAGMLEVFILLTLVSAIGWLPYFALDMILIKEKNVSTYDLQNINQYVGYGIAGFISLVVRPFLAWYNKKQRQLQDEAEAAEQQDAAEALAAATSSTSPSTPAGARLTPLSLTQESNPLNADLEIVGK